MTIFAEVFIKIHIMVIERTSNELIIRIPSFVDFERVQRIIDLLAYKEATAKSEAKQEDIDKIVNDAKKGWWEKHRAQFIK